MQWGIIVIIMHAFFCCQNESKQLSLNIVTHINTFCKVSMTKNTRTIYNILKKSNINAQPT